MVLEANVGYHPASKATRAANMSFDHRSWTRSSKIVTIDHHISMITVRELVSRREPAYGDQPPQLGEHA
jgi:hypothetical protein